jgi:hypothetical protein
MLAKDVRLFNLGQVRSGYFRLCHVKARLI